MWTQGEILEDGVAYWRQLRTGRAGGEGRVTVAVLCVHILRKEREHLALWFGTPLTWVFICSDISFLYHLLGMGRYLTA
jgi:hypothetical protein